MKIKSQIDVLDNGINLYSFFIPYEAIITYSYNNDEFFIEFFGSVELGDKTIKLKIDKSKTYLKFNLMNNNKAAYLSQLIKWNMFYHLKYNKNNIDKNIVEYYQK